MRYKNITKEILKFRANDAKGQKKDFELKSEEEFESDREVKFGGLELIDKVEKAGKGKSKKTKESE